MISIIIGGLLMVGRGVLPQQKETISPMIEEADQLRVNLYLLLARLLRAPPDKALLSMLAEMSGDNSDLGMAITDLSDAAGQASVADAAAEYGTLFIGLGRGLLIPYGSYYLTGFLHEKPLARLREDMAPLNIARNADVKDPEDHVAALMEMMAGLIDGSFGTMQPLAAQRAFFDRHVGIWTPHFFQDLENCAAAKLYAPVGRVGRLFMAIERGAFEM